MKKYRLELNLVIQMNLEDDADVPKFMTRIKDHLEKGGMPVTEEGDAELQSVLYDTLIDLTE